MITIIKQHNNKNSLSLRERVGVREQQPLATEVTERTEKLRLNTVHTHMSSRTNVRDLLTFGRSLTFVRDDSLNVNPYT